MGSKTLQALFTMRVFGRLNFFHEYPCLMLISLLARQYGDHQIYDNTEKKKSDSSLLTLYFAGQMLTTGKLLSPANINPQQAYRMSP